MKEIVEKILNELEKEIQRLHEDARNSLDDHRIDALYAESAGIRKAINIVSIHTRNIPQ